MCSRACTAASIWTISASSASTPTATLIGEFRIVGLFTSTAYTRSTRTIPYLRRKVDAVLQRAGFDPDGHSGKALVNVLETYPRDELFQIDEDTLYRVRAGDPAARRASARARAGAPRPLRPLRLGARLRAARPLRQRRARADRRLSRRGLSRAMSARSIRSSRKGRSSASTSSSAARRRDARSRTARRWKQAVGAIVRTWTDALARGAGASARAGARRARCSSAIATRSPTAIARPIRRRSRSTTSASSRACRRSARSASISTARTERRQAVRRPEGLELRPADPAVGARAGAGEHGLPRRRRAHLRDRARTPARRDVWLHDMMLERADGGADRSRRRCKARWRACFLVVMRGVAENDGYNALVLAAGLRWRDVALIRTISRFLRQIRVPYSQDYMWATLRKHAGARGADRRAVPRALRSARRDGRCAREREADDRRRDRGGAGRRSQSLDEDRILRHFVNAVQSAIRTNFYQLDADGQPKPQIAIKFDSRKLDGAAAAAAALRDLRLFAARRGRASALRQGRARRHPLVGPAAGFPHRGARPRQGAAGQERGDRAGRRQGRLRAEAAAGRRRRARRSQAEGIAAYKLFISTPARPHRQSRRRRRRAAGRTSCATTATIPISWSPPTRAPRPSPTSPTASRVEHDFWLGDAFASGGSAGYDHKKMGITARGAWEAVKRHFREMDVDIGTTPFTVVGVGDMSGDVFGNGMLRETHDQARRRLRPPRHLHRSRSRSGEELRRAQAAVRAAALELAGLRQGADLARAAASSRAR